MKSSPFAVLATLCALAATAAAEVLHYGSTDYVAKVGDDDTREHVTVVRSRPSGGALTTFVSYDRARLLEQRDDGSYRVELVQAYAQVPNGTFVGLFRRAWLAVSAEQLGATVFVLDCDAEGFCAQESTAPATGRLAVSWEPTGRTTRQAGTTTSESGGITFIVTGVSFVTPARARGVAFGAALEGTGQLDGQHSSVVQISR